MELELGPEDRAFREELREWLSRNAPPPAPSVVGPALRERDAAWQRSLHDAGYAGISWPREYGGRGLSLTQQMVWYEETARAGISHVNSLFVGLSHAGPTLIARGSDEQKAAHLPRILRGEAIWCQGFSEPGAGSDLASLRTTARRDGDDLVLDGGKIWTSYAQVADHQEMLVRTNPDAPKHRGITWLICDMDQPGIEIRPIRTLVRESHFCEVQGRAKSRGGCMRRQPWDEGAHAAEIVTAKLGGTAHRRDPGGGPEQLHDFDVELPDGRMIAFEVTRHTVAEYQRILSAFDQRNWRFTELQYDWVVDMIASYNVRSVHGQISELLATLELFGVESLLLRATLFDEGSSDDELHDDERAERDTLRTPEARDAVKRLWRLGARLVYRLTDAEPGGGEVFMSDTSQAGSTAPSVVVDLVEKHASLEDNTKKRLLAAEATERHLFVWVESSHHQAVAAFAFPSMPERAPNLPDHVDAVWAVTAYNTAHIWQYHRSCGWRDLGTWSRPE